MTNRTATILIVDDERTNRKLLEALLQHEGYATISVATGAAALASVASSPPDLILLDVMMPDLDGYQVATILKSASRTSNIPIIMVTALVDRDARLSSLASGAEDFLTKPVDRAELSLRVRNLLRLKEYGDLLSNQRAALEREVGARTADLQRFRTAMDSAGDAIFLVDRATMRVVEVNTTASALFGYARDEFLRVGAADLGVGTVADLATMYDSIIAGHETTHRAETIVRKDGSELPVEVRRHAQPAGSGWIIVEVMRDITERVEADRRLHHLAHYDALTGLPNRTLFYETLRRTLTQASIGEWFVAVLFIDLDHFKSVNDTLGHAVGDELLKQFADRLVGCVRIRDTVGRLGGDEFALILVMPEGQHGAPAVALKIREILDEPFHLQGHEVSVAASIGITVFPDDAIDHETLIKYADTAMYQAKQAGGSTFRFFTAAMNTAVLNRLEMEAALRAALARDEFVLYYQPKVQLNSGRVSGVEALLRWNRPGCGLVSPGEFIPVLEETGLIVDVGRWVIGAACEQVARWLRSPVGPMAVSVNVSGRQFTEGDLSGDVLRALKDNDVPADLLELELTESSLMASTERTVSILNELKAHGVRISIDDFGTGYSSLSYLRRFPIDTLKIDIAFVRDITSNPDDAAIAIAIIRMAHSLKLDVIAEGVETASQLAYLSRYHCDQIQGYYFSPPLPVAELEQLLHRGKELPAPDHDARRKTLLVVDGDVSSSRALRHLLRRDGYTILSAVAADEAFEILAQHRVQVMLCDQQLSTMRSAEFLGRVRELHPDTLRIVMSAHADLASIMDAVNQAGIYRFYTKPWDAKELRGNIRDAFRHYWALHDSLVEQRGTDVLGSISVSQSA